MSEIEEKVLDILRKRRDRAIGEPFGLRARAISEEVGGISPQEMGKILKNHNSITFYRDSNDSKRYFLEGDGSE